MLTAQHIAITCKHTNGRCSDLNLSLSIEDLQPQLSLERNMTNIRDLEMLVMKVEVKKCNLITEVELT